MRSDKGASTSSGYAATVAVGLAVAIAIRLLSTTAVAADAPSDTDAASDSGPMAEVTVTATRREESLSKVPISLSVMTNESMEIKGVKDISDIARLTPGVTIDSSQTNAISIRGISSTGGSGTTGIYIDDVPIQVRDLGFNSDDALLKIFDLERVEVLRGPQGTLFGAGSEGGTVRYITTPPSLTKSSVYAKAETSYTQGGTISYEAGLAVGAPVIDGVLGVRASAWYRRDGGWIDRVDPTTLADVDSNANHDGTQVMRLAALWQPMDNLRVSPSIYYQKRDRHDVTIYWPTISDPSSNRYESLNPTARQEPDKLYLPSVNVEADLGSVRLISTTAYFHRDEISGYDGTLYNLGYFQTQMDPTSPLFPLLDGSGVHLPPGLEDYRAPASVTNQQRNFSQEIRLQSSDPTARVQWTIGGFYSLNRQFSLEEIHDPMADQLYEAIVGDTIADWFGAPTNPDGSSYLPNGDSYLNRLVSHDRQLAGFGELNYNLTDSVKLTAGVRVARIKFDIQSFSDGPQNSGVRPGGSSSTETAVTPKAGVQWQIDPANMVYFTYAKGFRPGGGNPSIPYDPTYQDASIGCTQDFINLGIPKAPDTYKSDSVHSFEVGAKDTIANRLRLASSVYYIRWNNIQGNVVPPICQIQFTDNLGNAISKGFDVQAELEVTRDFTVDATYGYTDARYTKDGFPTGVDPATAAQSGVLPLVLRGDAIGGPNGIGTGFSIPPWTATIGAEYKFNVLDHDSFIRLDYEYEAADKYSHAALEGSPSSPLVVAAGAVPDTNYDPRTSTYDPTAFAQGRQSFASARLGTSLGDWAVSFFVDNLTDSHTTINFNHQTNPYAYDANGNNTGALQASASYRYITYRPRTFGITVTLRR
jgi:iron complex outermembrane receptor protein